MENQASIGRIGYFKGRNCRAAKWCKPGHLSFTCRVPQLFNRIALTILEMKRVPQMSATADNFRFNSRVDKFLLCVLLDQPLNGRNSHHGRNTLAMGTLLLWEHSCCGNTLAMGKLSGSNIFAVGTPPQARFRFADLVAKCNCWCNGTIIECPHGCELFVS